MHYLYILYSENIDRYYTGQSANIDQRLKKHNNGHSSATKSGVPWKVKKVVEFDTKSQTIRAENWLKKMKSRKIIKQIIDDEIDLKKIVIG